MKKLFTLLFLTACFFGKSVTAQNTACTAAFNITYQNANTVQFAPAITGDPTTTQHDWLFGDGGSSQVIAPVHTYLNQGTYTARHIVVRFISGTTVPCRDTVYKLITIQGPTTCNLVANFVPTIAAGTVSVVHFQNTTTPVNTTDSVRWTFGDGTESHDYSPTHTYAVAGTYTVCLRMQQRNPNGVLTNCVSEICHTVVIQSPTTCNLIANFTITPVASAPNAFVFTNTSTPLNPADSIRWTFGDGTSGTGSVITHVFAQSGTYNVCLRVQQRNSNGTLSNCVKEICHAVAVTLPTTCNLVANFTIAPVTATPNAFHFTNTSVPLNNTDSIRWTFGDGTFSNDPNPTHTYTQNGTFNVCLRVQQRNPNGVLTNCIKEICHAVAVTLPTTCNLVASFTVSPVAGSANSFHFENTSVPLNNTDSIRWTFGDGTSSNQVSPNHTYQQSGTYTVCLRIQQRTAAGVLTNCVKEICHTITVMIPTTCNLVANFTITPLTGAPTGNAFFFTNTSTPSNPTDSIRWTFGDGTSGTGSVVTHVYAQSGTYNVCLRVQQRNSNGTLSNCIKEICHAVAVTLPTTCNLVANFTSTVVPNVPPAGPYIVSFVNTSTPLNPADSVRWTFGDGTSSNDLNPTHTYTAAGTYNVCLRVQQRGPNGALTNCIREICHTIILPVPSACNLLANFTITPVTATPNSFHFVNTSTGMNNTDSIRWTFGDGTSSNDLNPTHTYAQPGTYNVCLRIIKRSAAGVLSNCVSEKCLTVVVQGSNTCNLIVNFTSTILTTTPTGGPFVVHFQNTSTPLNATDSIRWTFGDGTSSNDLNPNHTYTQPGSYNVCLRVQQRNPNGGLTNCIREVCHVIYVPGPVLCNLLANFYAYRMLVTGTAFPYLYHFENTSAGFSPTDSIRWTFGDGTSSNQVSPNHGYTTPGTYNVCLRIIKRTSTGTLTNCISEICHPVVIVPLNPNVCNLQPFPNPVNTSVTVNVVLGLPQMIDVFIYNAMNTLVKEKHQAGVTGNNLVTVGTADLPQGIYIMKVIHGNDICYATFIKL